MSQIGYKGYMSYELCHPLPVKDGQTVDISYAHQNAQLAAEFMRELIDSASMTHSLVRPFMKTWLALVLCVGLGLAGSAVAQEKRHNLLVIGQSKGYQHEAVSSAMATLYNLGRQSGRWNTYFRTDCTAITKKPLKWGAKNLNAFDAVAFYTDGDLDMDESQKADLLSFVRDDGKGFIGIHSATITFLSWPEYGRMIGGYFDGHPWGNSCAPGRRRPGFSRHEALPSRFHAQG